MKRFFSFLAAATMLFAASCAEDTVGTDNGNEAQVTFNLGLEGQSGTRANATYGTGVTVTDLHYAVFDGKGNRIATIEKVCKPNEFGSNDNTANVKLTLAKDQWYTVVFWAQHTDAAYEVSDDMKVTVKYPVDANLENRDAFYGRIRFQVKGSETFDNILLTRPFAQLNVGVTAEDYTAAKNSGVEITKSKAVVKGLCNTLDLLTGKATGNVEEEFAMAATPKSADEELRVKLNGTDETFEYLSMNYILIGEGESEDEAKANISASFEFSNEDGSKKIAFNTGLDVVPVERNHRTNIIGQILTGNLDFNVTIQPIFANENFNAHVVKTDEQLAAALNSNDKNIVIFMGADLSFNVSNTNIQVGGEKTETITIYGYDDVDNEQARTSVLPRHTLTLYTTYWSYLNTKNPNAKIIFKNMNLTSTQTSGTWNSYDIAFKCNVELDDVTLQKAMALDGVGKTAKLTNVTINETHDYYALWIAAAGQTVTIDGLTINSPNGRGIKIDEQYVSAEDKAMVTLNIKNATFKTKNKSAIIVKSTEGAKIDATNLNIDEVEAETEFAVWVDEDSKAYVDKVDVTGAKVIVEGYVPVYNWDQFTAALADGAYILLKDNIPYDKSYDLKKNVTIDLNGKSLEISDPALMLNIFSKATIKNGTIKGKVYARTTSDIIFDGVTFGGSINGGGSIEASLQVQGACNVYAKNCAFNATNSNSTKSRPLSIQSTSSGTYRFEGCSFKSNTNQNQVYVNPMSGTATLDFTNCNFNNKTPNIMLAAACPFTSLTMSGTTKLSSVTLETNRAKTAITEAEWAYIRTLIANNSFSSVRVFYAGGSSEYIR